MVKTFHYVDMHGHLDFCDDPKQLAREAAAQRIAFFNCTVTPSNYARAQQAFKDCPSVRVGAGLHPWWIAHHGAGLAEADAVAKAIADGCTYVGEIGLDFSEAHGHEQGIQVSAFKRIVTACAERPGNLLSIHGVKSAGTILDILEKSHALEGNTCIMHWFSGTSEELQRAIKHQIRFSINARMVQSRRGREYIRQIPLSLLLLETDLPANQGDTCSASDLLQSLQQTADAISHIKGTDCQKVMAEAGAELLALI